MLMQIYPNLLIYLLFCFAFLSFVEQERPFSIGVWSHLTHLILSTYDIPPPDVVLCAPVFLAYQQRKIIEAKNRTTPSQIQVLPANKDTVYQV